MKRELVNMKTALFKRVQAALEKDMHIVVPRDQVQKSLGYSLKHFEELGLSKTDLKQLESQNLAQRGYLKNRWVEGEMLPNGTLVGKDQIFNGTGHQVRWILLCDPVGDVSGKSETLPEVSEGDSQSPR